MKFHQLPLGARFAFHGTTFRKISPLKAASDTDDRQKLIPRSAQVSRLGEDTAATAAPATLPTSVAGVVVETATWCMVDDCRSAVARIDPPLDDAQQAQVRAALEVAAQKLLLTLTAE